MKICFYTEGHLGDFIITVPFINFLIKKYPEHEYYQYVYGSQGTRYPDILIKTVPNLIPTEKIDGDLEIPTWFCDPIYRELIRNGPEPYDMYSNQRYFWSNLFYSCDFDVEIPDDGGLEFDFKSILDKKTVSAIRKFGKTPRKKILFINIKGRSGQTDNDDWLDKIDRLSEMYPQIDFCYMNKEKIKVEKDNVIHTPSIFGDYPSDLVHNSYLGTFCDIIVGRNSGAYQAIAMQTKNVVDPDKLFICQTQNNIHKPDLECFYNSKIYKAKNIHTEFTKETFFELEKILCQ